MESIGCLSVQSVRVFLGPSTRSHTPPPNLLHFKFEFLIDESSSQFLVPGVISWSRLHFPDFLTMDLSTN